MGFGLIFLIVFLSFVIFFMNYKINNLEPTTLYTVYLDGKHIGNIESKDSFDEFINSKEEELKKKYDVDTVHTPKGVEIRKNFTYNTSVKSNEQIYNKIISNKKFTISGYQITIHGDEEDTNIYVLSKDIFDEAVENIKKNKKYIPARKRKKKADGDLQFIHPHTYF